MEQLRPLWDLAQQTMLAFMPFYRQAMDQAIQDSGAPQQWFGLSLARGCHPQPFSVDRFHKLAPYGTAERLAETLDGLARLELLERVGEGAYQLTDAGLQAVEGIFRAAHRAMAEVEPLPSEEMDQLNDLLRRLVEATLAAAEPRDKGALIASRWTDPGVDAPGAVRTDQYLTDLSRFRDDAHIAAWQPHGVSGQAWEALTFLWRGQVQTAQQLAEQLPFRGYTAEEYQAALQELVGRGWILESGEGYALTTEGRRVREEAEEATDRHFSVGWSALKEQEIARLGELLAAARTGLEMAAVHRLHGLAGEVSSSIGPLTQDLLSPLVEQYNLAQPGLTFLASLGQEAEPRLGARIAMSTLLNALRFAPEPISAERIGERNPYGHPSVQRTLLGAVAEAGFLRPVEGGYVLSGAGRQAGTTLLDAFYRRLGELDVLPTEDLQALEGLLKRLAAAMREAEEPAAKPCTELVHRGHPEAEYGPLARIDQHLDEVHAFRDDAHLGAWRPYGVDGHAWEALTFLWRGEASTADQLAEKLPFRGHSAEAYDRALAGLAQRGWVERTDTGYQVTPKGAALRQQVEDATDRIYAAPWAALNSPEKAQLDVLLRRLRDALQARAEQA